MNPPLTGFERRLAREQARERVVGALQKKTKDLIKQLQDAQRGTMSVTALFILALRVIDQISEGKVVFIASKEDVEAALKDFDMDIGKASDGRFVYRVVPAQDRSGPEPALIVAPDGSPISSESQPEPDPPRSA